MLKASNPNLTASTVISGVGTPIMLALQVCVVAGLILASPIWLYQLWAFIVPALMANEKKYAMYFLGAAIPLFLFGVAVGYLIMPQGISVMLSFTPSSIPITNLLEVNDFLKLQLQLMVIFGLGFLMPVVVVGINLIGLVSSAQLAKARTFVIFGTFVFGAAATPSTDPFSMLALALPMSLLYVARRAGLPRQRPPQGESCCARGGLMPLHYNGPTLTLVVNPSAGGGRARRLLPKVTTALLTGLPGASLRVFQTSTYAEARLRCIAAVEQARPAAAGPDDRLPAGDGRGRDDAPRPQRLRHLRRAAWPDPRRHRQRLLPRRRDAGERGSRRPHDRRRAHPADRPDVGQREAGRWRRAPLGGFDRLHGVRRKGELPHQPVALELRRAGLRVVGDRRAQPGSIRCRTGC